MTFVLRTVKNGKGVDVFYKQKTPEGIAYMAKAETGEIGKVNKTWVLKNKSLIVNLGVSADNKIYPVKNKAITENKCDCCGEKHSVSVMQPVYIIKDGRVKKSKRMVCKGCIGKENFDNQYVQCYDCGKVFDREFVDVVDVFSNIYNGRDSVVFEVESEDSPCEYLCNDCCGSTFSICTQCSGYDSQGSFYAENKHQCMYKNSEYNKEYDCPNYCAWRFKNKEDEDEDE